MLAETYQVGAHFRALIKTILVEPSRILENFVSFHVSLPRCEHKRFMFLTVLALEPSHLCKPVDPELVGEVG